MRKCEKCKFYVRACSQKDFQCAELSDKDAECNFTNVQMCKCANVQMCKCAKNRRAQMRKSAAQIIFQMQKSQIRKSALCTIF